MKVFDRRFKSPAHKQSKSQSAMMCVLDMERICRWYSVLSSLNLYTLCPLHRPHIRTLKSTTSSPAPFTTIPPYPPSQPPKHHAEYKYQDNQPPHGQDRNHHADRRRTQSYCHPCTGRGQCLHTTGGRRRRFGRACCPEPRRRLGPGGRC